MRPESHWSSFPTSSSSQHRSSQKKSACYLSFWACVAVASMAAIVIATFFSIFYLVASTFTGVRHDEHLVNLGCNTSDCFKLEGLLGDSLNASVNPCEDFKAYVTSRWLPDPRSQVTQLWNYQWHVKYGWLRRLAGEIRSRHYSTVPLFTMVAKSFRACENRSTENADETRKLFKRLLRNLSIPWPEVPPRDADPFEAHLNLCVRWNIPLWFDVRLLPDYAITGTQRIYVGPSVYAKFWRSQYVSMNSDSVVNQYLKQYLVNFLDQSNADHAAPTVNYKEVFNFTKHVVLKLDEIHGNKGPEFFTFKTLADALGQNPDRFVSLMNRYFHPKSSFVRDDVAIVKKKGTTEIVRYITAKHDPALILSHLGWWILQIYAPIADARFFVQKYGSNELADLLRPLFCETQMESSFKILLLSQHATLNFPGRVRHDIEDVLINVREAAATMYEESNLAPVTSSSVAQKIRGMRFDLWPRPRYASRDELQKIYSAHYTTRNTTLDHWITERKANADLIGTEAYFEDKRLPHSFSKDSVYYDTLLNTVRMSMIVVHDPFYYPDGGAAINYGGLGAALSKTIVEGIATELDAKKAGPAELTPANGTFATKGNHTATESLPVTGFLPAFRAFQALKRSSQPLHGFPPKLFFINYCHTQTRIWAGFDCNKELRGAADFVSVFQCDKGSRMNP